MLCHALSYSEHDLNDAMEEKFTPLYIQYIVLKFINLMQI